MELTQRDLATYNRAAGFIEGDHDAFPGVSVAGVMVLVHIDHTGKLVINVDTVDTDDRLRRNDRHRSVAVSVRMDGTEVWAD